MDEPDRPVFVVFNHRSVVSLTRLISSLGLLVYGAEGATYRYPRCTQRRLRRRQGIARKWEQWLLFSRLQSLPNLAPTIPGSVRGIVPQRSPWQVRGLPTDKAPKRVLYDLVQMIASWYPSDRHEAFQKAAENFRIPYWDWAAKPPGGEHVFPIKITGSPRIEVDGPNGKQNISNPLFSYTFKPLDPSIFEEFPVCLPGLH